MADFKRKVLWIVSFTKALEPRAFKHAEDCGVEAVCIRSDNVRLENAIGGFHQKNIAVYAWRWPAVLPKPGSKTHWYAKDEAAFVAEKLIPAGLDGYIIDPESEPGQPSDDWNNAALALLAREFCQHIQSAAKNAGRGDFVFGITSGCNYPAGLKYLPWGEFVAASDALFPQTYWRWTNNKKVQNINGGTPDKAIKKGLHSWARIARNKRIIPMAGEIDVVAASEIKDYASALKELGLDQYHFYADNSGVSKSTCDAINHI
jgi:hypothetical protein